MKTEYAGNKVYKNGTLSMILTQEGYLTLAGTTPTYYYYLKDHQGNNRVVINQSGAVQQVNHYYPFGGLFGEGIQTSNQPYKYNGKELDRFQGVDMYDFHWRQYMADLGRTTTVDPMAEKYYSISPYVYVVNNPARFIDPDGKSPYYTEKGIFLGVDKRGFAGKIIISTMNNYLFAVNRNISLKDNKFIENTKLTAGAYSNIYTHILEESGYNTKMLIGNAVSVRTDDEKFNNPSEKKDLFISTTVFSDKKEFKVSINQSDEILPGILSTVENVQNALGEHEFKGHGIMRYSDRDKSHHKAYELQFDSETWEKTTSSFQEEMMKRYLNYLNYELQK